MKPSNSNELTPMQRQNVLKGNPIVEQYTPISPIKFLTEMGRLWINACKDEDPETFHTGTGEQAKAAITDAKAICSRCVINLSCLNYALTYSDETGIWGGKTESERKGMLRTRARSMTIVNF